MRVDDIPEYGWQYIDDRKQNENILFLSFIDIINGDDNDED